jgi:hypothetical protein
MAFIVDKKYIIDDSPDYDFGELRLLAPEPYLRESFGSIDDSQEDDYDDDDDESDGTDDESFKSGGGIPGFMPSAQLDKLLKGIRPQPAKCFECGAELIGPFCYSCGLKSIEQ